MRPPAITPASKLPSSTSWRTVLITFAALLAVTASVYSPAHADPPSEQVRGDLDRAQQRLDEIEEELSHAVEAYNAAHVAVEELDAARDETRAQLATLEADHDSLSDVVDAHVRRLHKLGPAVELSAVLLTGDPTETGAKVSSLRRILDEQRTDLEELGATSTSIRALEERLTEQQAEANERVAELEEHRHAVEAAFAAHETEIERLEAQLAQSLEREAAERRARAEAERRARQTEQARQRETDAAQSSQRGDRSETDTESAASSSAPAQETQSEASTAASAPRASAQVAINTALAQLGKPYQWGGGGPNSFDCSGLTSYAWAAAGVNLPRTSAAQYAATTRISRDQLQPGDLVFYHSPISHVAMYIGNGQVVEAPNSGNPVRIRTDGLTRRGVVGFGRP